ncbi:MAG: glycosyltransferase family 1 protein [Rhodospirillaceae bacterium]|nr:glycosyltransferase family 1 protein [Rhodospirillaceae bacterium]
MEVIVCTGEAQADWAIVHMSDLHQGFVNIGVDATHVHLVDGDMDGFRQMIAAKQAAGDKFFIVSQNGGAPGDGAAKFNFVGDHPLDHYQTISDPSENAIYSFVDRRQTDLGCLRLDNPPKAIFCPTGAPKATAEPLAMAARDIDILFSGSIFFDPDRASWGTRFGDNDLLRDIFTDAVDACIEEYEDAYRAIVRAREARSVDPLEMEFDLLRSLFGLVEGCCQAQQRHQIISSLRDVNVVVMGEFPSNAFDASVNVELIGYKSFTEALEMMGRSKVALNIVPKFSDGAHERIFYGMAAGAVVLTTTSDYVAETFTDNENILFIERGGKFDAAAVADLLADTKRLDEMTASARVLFEAGHTWDVRAKVIVEKMDSRLRGNDEGKTRE